MSNFSKKIIATQPKIIIIGAGIAGLTAANILLNNGFLNIKIIEASLRYGGRVFANKFGTIEKCMHGYKNSTLSTDNKTTTNLLMSQGKIINQNISSLTIIKELDEITKKIKSSGIKKNLLLDFNMELLNFVNNLPTNKRNKLNMKNFLATIHNLRRTFGTDLTNVNTNLALIGLNKGLNKSTDIIMDFSCPIKYLNNIVSSLPNTSNDSILLLGKPVKEINYELQPIKIYCLDNTIFNADYVICTLPLGTLQTFNSYLFKPKLSNDKINSIDQMGNGKVERIFLEFHEPIKKLFPISIQLALCPHEIFFKKMWFTGISDIQLVDNNEFVLEISVAGDQAEDMISINNEIIIRDLRRILKQILGDTNVLPKIKTIARTNWSKNTCFLGSNVYPSINTKSNYFEIIEQPICVPGIGLNKSGILFAGDAITEPMYLGKYVGAKLSGINAANKIINSWGSV